MCESWWARSLVLDHSLIIAHVHGPLPRCRAKLEGGASLVAAVHDGPAHVAEVVDLKPEGVVEDELARLVLHHDLPGVGVQHPVDGRGPRRGAGALHLVEEAEGEVAREGLHVVEVEPGGHDPLVQELDPHALLPRGRHGNGLHDGEPDVALLVRDLGVVELVLVHLRAEPVHVQQLRPELVPRPLVALGLHLAVCARGRHGWRSLEQVPEDLVIEMVQAYVELQVATVALALESSDLLDPVRPTTDAEECMVITPARVSDIVSDGDACLQVANRFELLRELFGVKPQVNDIVVIETPCLHIIRLVVVTFWYVICQREVPIDIPDTLVLHALDRNGRFCLGHWSRRAKVLSGGLEADVLFSQLLVGVDCLCGRDKVGPSIVLP
mmetsp:Transcript_6143/g.12600  ORF Transcript_6143/g.12600 Transcript_6143/m.12600 type:complete len:383 (-) Transcript_6143:115-1263(-)